MSELAEGHNRHEPRLRSTLFAAVFGGVIGAVVTAAILRTGDSSAGLQGEVQRLTVELSSLKKQHLDLKKDIESRRGIIPLASGTVGAKR